MRGSLSLVLAGVLAVALGALGTVAVASSLTGSSSEAAQSANDAETLPGAYGTR